MLVDIDVCLVLTATDSPDIRATAINFGTLFDCVMIGSKCYGNMAPYLQCFVDWLYSVDNWFAKLYCVNLYLYTWYTETNAYLWRCLSLGVWAYMFM